MRLAIYPGISPVRCRSDSVYLALCFLGGAACGIVVFLGAGSSLSSLMRGIAEGAVSFTGLLCSALLPFLISAFAVFLSRSALLTICFGKAFLFAFAFMGISQAFGSAGWLACRLAMFSDVLLLPLLYFFWLRILSGRISRLGIAAVLSLAFLVVSIDYRMVSPLWASLIEIQKG